MGTLMNSGLQLFLDGIRQQLTLLPPAGQK
jgi:hypothetical protein